MIPNTRLFYPKTFLSQVFSIPRLFYPDCSIPKWKSSDFSIPKKYDNILGNTLLTIVYVNQKYEFICCI